MNFPATNAKNPRITPEISPTSGPKINIITLGDSVSRDVGIKQQYVRGGDPYRVSQSQQHAVKEMPALTIFGY
jgi:hypothetical protein